ncbi:C40 family peptidase [Bacillus sp. 165]|uniref:C40 family peptidase n=1 Tax=Bacillus sp. 165 TaxID=1529117 RepID=UPI001ADC97AF|nr:C40 family peptidase [Bacillus sp. 165]MBO9129951.1 C40 family peptidase [Bacillus sp. 165]
MKKVKIMSCALAAGFMMFTALTPNAHAEKNNNVNVQINKTNNTLQTQKEERNRLQKEIKELKKTTKDLETKIKENQAKLDATKKNITDTQRIINEKVEKIAQLEEQIQKREYIIKQRLVAMQDQPRVNIVTQVLVNSKSIVDLMERINSLSLIFESDTTILEAQERDQKQVETEKEAILQKQAELRAYEKELTNTQTELVDDKQKKREALDEMSEKLNKIVMEMSSTQSQLRQLEREAAALQDAYEEEEQTSSNTSGSGTTTPEKPPVIAPPVSNSNVVNYAMKFLGKPYVFGAAGPNAFDCSGFISYVFKKSRTDVSGYLRQATMVSNPQPGDLVFFKNTYKPGPSHMGIYIGNGKMIHASSSQGITISSVRSSYYNSSRWIGYGRF